MKTNFPIPKLRLIIFMFCLLLVSCSSLTSAAPEVEDTLPAASDSSIAPAQSASLPEMKAAHAWRIAFIPKFKLLSQTGKLSSYWQPAWEGAQKAGVDFGVEVELVTANVTGSSDADYVEPQIRLIAELIARGDIDGLVVAPFDSNRLAPVIEKAIAADISVVAMDTPVNSDQLLTFVTFDNFSAGKAAGEWAVKQAHGKGNVLILDGPQDQQNAVDRRNGFLAGLNAGNMVVLNTQSADWEIDPAREITAGWLGKYADINIIMAANDNMALGAAAAVADAKRKGILITGFDATDAALQALKAGQISATIDQAPGEQARLAVLAVIRHLEKREKFPARIFLPHIPLITSENVDLYLAQRGLK